MPVSYTHLVEDVFTITGRGTVATGRVERGTVQVGDAAEIVGPVSYTHLDVYKRQSRICETG